MLTFSNDTDTIAVLLIYFDIFKLKGLIELWVYFGKGESKRMIPVHAISDKIGHELSRNIIKLHILTGSDYTSKVGTKHAALECSPLPAVSLFGESSVMSE